MADAHPNVIAWGSETHRIPYKNPLTGKATTYVPDMLMVYEDKNKNRKAEIIEIKPSGQTLGEARGAQNQAAAVVNQAKWEAEELGVQSKDLDLGLLQRMKFSISHKIPKGKKDDKKT